jgi:hypothetical protein
MRAIAFAVAAIFVSAPAGAQNWEEYRYPDYAFSVVFPANPQVETTTYQITDNRSVPARIYSVRHNDTVLKMTIAEIGNAGLDEDAAIDHAIKMLSQGGEVKDNIPQRVDRVYGRQVSLAWADGSHSEAAVFDYKGRLYQIEAKALPGRTDNSADILRFEQSLVFTDDGSNRSEDTIRAGKPVQTQSAHLRVLTTRAALASLRDSGGWRVSAIGGVAGHGVSANEPSDPPGRPRQRRVSCWLFMPLRLNLPTA